MISASKRAEYLRKATQTLRESASALAMWKDNHVNDETVPDKVSDLITAEIGYLRDVASQLRLDADELERGVPVPAGCGSMNTAPRDGTPILAYCVHGADPYFIDGTDTLTTYGAHSEGMRNVVDGWHVVQFGGEYDGDESDGPIPPWWFLNGSDFEIVANPVCWMPLPEYSTKGDEG